MEQAQREVSARWLGRVAYDDAHLLQRQLVAERIEGRGIDTLLALEHDPVLTLGRNASPEHLHLTEAEYVARGIAVRHVERGGEVTYHGPGHLVVYPIIALRAGGITLREHIRALEGALIDACAAYGITKVCDSLFSLDSFFQRVAKVTARARISFRESGLFTFDSRQMLFVAHSRHPRVRATCLYFCYPRECPAD